MAEPIEPSSGTAASTPETGNRIRRATVQMILLRQVGFLIIAVNVAVLARLLKPSEFGLFALALSIMTVAETITDFGLSAFVVKSRRPDRVLLARAMGLALMIAWGLAVLIAAVLLLLPDGLVEPGLDLALILLALRLALKPLSLPIEAALSHQIRFGLISALGPVRIAVEGAVAITCAMSGLGVAALAAGLLAEMCAAILLFYLFGPREVRVAPSFSGVRDMMGFGRTLTLAKLIPHLGTLGVVSALGGLLGTAALGLFNRAQTLAGLFDKLVLDAIRPVVLPAMARSFEEKAETATLYARVLDLLSSACWPLFAGMIIMAGPLVAIALGPQWQGAVPAFQMLAIGGFALPLFKTSMNLFITIDRLQPYMRIQVIYVIAMLVFTLLGALHSLMLACLGFALAQWVKSGLVALKISEITETPLRVLFASVPRTLGLTLMTIAPLGALALLPTGVPVVIELIGGVSLCAAGWLSGSILLRDPLLQEVLRATGLRRASSR